MGGGGRGARVAVLAVLAGIALAGCSRSSPYQDFTAPGAVPFGPSSTPGPTEPTGVVGAIGPSGTERADSLSGGRAMTPAQRQARDNCARGIVLNGCKYYSDWSLQLQGIDPDR